MPVDDDERRPVDAGDAPGGKADQLQHAHAEIEQHQGQDETVDRRRDQQEGKRRPAEKGHDTRL